MATATKTRDTATTLTMSRQTLLAAIAAASKAVVGAKSPKPVLRNVRIGDGLVTGTDLELRIDVAIEQHCEPFLVPAERLLQILRSSQSEDVSLTAGKTSIAVKCGLGSWTLPTEDVNEFPTWEPEGLQEMPSIPEDQFMRAIESVIHAVDNQSSRYALGGVLIEAEEEDVWFVATDGRIACWAVCGHDFATDVFVQKPSKQGERKAPIVPPSALKIAQEFCKKEGEKSVFMRASESVIVLSAGDVTVTSMLISGNFPRWRDLSSIPGCSAASVCGKSFESAIFSAAIVSSQQSKGVRISWKEREVCFHAESSEYGKSVVSCPVATSGDCVDTKLDPVFVRQFLNALPENAPPVDVYSTGSADKVFFGCDYDEDKKRYAYTGVIMPLAEDA